MNLCQRKRKLQPASQIRSDQELHIILCVFCVIANSEQVCLYAYFPRAFRDFALDVLLEEYKSPIDPVLVPLCISGRM